MADSLFAVVVSPDRQHTFADIRPDVIRSLASWNDLPAVLQDLRQRSQASGQAVVLDLAVHGNNGTGLKVVSESAAGELASITSMAEVNRMIKAAGFAPGEIVVLTEGCNVHRSWTASADGFTATEKQAALHQAEHLSTSHGGKLAAAPEVVDHGPTKLDKSYLWLGRGPGTNWISTVFLQYVTGEEDGAPLQDLRHYTNPKAPLATQTDEVQRVAGMRAEMIAELKGTRFAPPPVTTTTGLRFMDRLGIRATAPSADDSGPATSAATGAPGASPTPPQLVPVHLQRHPPATPTPAPAGPAPAPTGTTPPPAMPRFIDRLRAIQH